MSYVKTYIFRVFEIYVTCEWDLNDSQSLLIGKTHRHTGSLAGVAAPALRPEQPLLKFRVCKHLTPTC